MAIDGGAAPGDVVWMSQFDPQAAQKKIARILQLMKGHTDRAEEAEVLGLFRGAARGELDFMLMRLPLADLIADIDDRVIGPDNRTALLNLLCAERLTELSAGARAGLINGLQQGRTGSAREDAIQKVFLGTLGDELTALKNAVDSSGDYHDLHQLVYRDIDDDKVRSAIVKHIQAQAKPRKEFKILSDVDDTLYRNWKDPRWPSKTIYPGVRAFYAVLDWVGSADKSLGDLTFLTARPGDRAGISEGITRKNLGERNLSYAKVLTGDFGHLVTHELMAEKKVMGFREYQKLFPEYRFVFLGDSGQGDAIAGERMRDESGAVMEAVFIHDVVNTGENERERLRKKAVYFNDTYIGAALDAYTHGLIDAEGLGHVAREAVRELKDPGHCSFESAQQKDARYQEFGRDIERVNQVLGAEERICL